MKISEAIARLQVVLNRGIPSNDNRLSDEYLYSLLRTYRAKRIRQKADQAVYLSPFNYSTIQCMPLELGKFNDCPCFTSNCYILRSKDKLPRILNNRVGMMIKSVTTIDGRLLSASTPSREEFKEFTRTGNNTDRLSYFIYNDRLYVKGSTTLKVVAVTALFFDPLELISISACNDEGDELPIPCWNPKTEEFPIDEDIFDDVENMILEKLMKSYEQLPEDNENNARSTEGDKE